MTAETAPPTSRIDLAVCGAHLEGQPLHRQLSDRNAVLVERTTTAPEYRLYALDTQPPKPGLVHVTGDGAAIALEVWSLTPEAFASFVDAVPAPMCIGRVTLASGRDVAGFLCEPFALEGAADITQFGGWLAFRQAGDAPR
jgi:allophanate hydrolase